MYTCGIYLGELLYIRYKIAQRQRLGGGRNNRLGTITMNPYKSLSKMVYFSLIQCQIFSAHFTINPDRQRAVSFDGYRLVDWRREEGVEKRKHGRKENKYTQEKIKIYFYIFSLCRAHFTNIHLYCDRFPLSTVQSYLNIWKINKFQFEVECAE